MLTGNLEQDARAFVGTFQIPRKDRARVMAKYIEAMRPTDWEIEASEIANAADAYVRQGRSEDA